jgi:hypothetical protein
MYTAKNLDIVLGRYFLKRLHTDPNIFMDGSTSSTVPNALIFNYTLVTQTGTISEF